MDLNNIELPAFTIADLYRTSLVDAANRSAGNEIPAPAGAGKEKDPKKIEWPSLGNNRKNILILVDHPDLAFLPDEELKFLSGILTACKMGLEDVAIVNLAHHPGTSYKQLIGPFRPRTALLFGIAPSGLEMPVNFPPFQPQAVAGITYLYSPPLGELENDKLLKSKLWVCLKRIFSI